MQGRSSGVSARLLPVAREGAPCGVALAFHRLALFLEIPPLPLQTHCVLSCPKSFFSILCNTLFSSPGAASVVVGHPLDTIKVKPSQHHPKTCGQGDSFT